MREYDINGREIKTVKTEDIIKKIFNHSSEQMLLCYIGEVVKDSLD